MQTNTTFVKLSSVATAALLLSACQSLPGTAGQQGAVIGGAAGAATGAVVAGSGHRALGAVLGGLLGAGGGYVIGAKTGKVNSQDTAGAQRAKETAVNSPATAEQARTATSADLNKDGFVTLDEVVAMKQAGFSDQKMIDYLRRTGQVFELTPDQRRYLADRGVDQTIIDQMAAINQPGTASPQPASKPSGTISQPQ